MRTIQYDGVRANARLGDHHLAITLRGPDGRVKDERSIYNTVPANGKNLIADRLLASPTLAVPSHMAVGTGTPSTTLLGTETSRLAFTSTQTRSGAVVTFIGDWAAGVATGALTEAGVFNIATANTITMLMSSSFAVVNKGSLDTLNVTWTLTIS